MSDDEAHQEDAPANPNAPTLNAGKKEPIKFRARRTARTNAHREANIADVWPFGEMSPASIAQMMRASVVTVRRWRRKRCLPMRLRPLARLLMHGELSVISPVWEGWSLRQGELHSSYYTRPFTVADMEYYSSAISRLSTLEQAVRHLGTENRRLRQALSTEAAAHVAQRAEQRAALKAIGGAELLMAMAMRLRDELEQAGTQDEGAQFAVLGASHLVRSLYLRNDPGTGEPYCVNNAASGPAEGGDESATTLTLVEPPSAA